MTSSPPATGRARNPRGGGAALGRQIVTTACDVIDDAGVAGLTLRGLARTIGVSAPAIYAHFADVDAILLKVAERAFADLSDHLRAAVDASPAPAARLRCVCEAYLDYAAQHPGRYQVMFGGQWDATAAAERGAVGHDDVGGLGQDVLAVLRDAVEASTTDPTAGSTTLAEAATTWVFLHGYAHQRLVARAFPWPPDMDAHVVDRLTAPFEARARGDVGGA